MDRKKKIKALIALSLSLSFLTYYFAEFDYKPQYKIIAHDDGPFGEFSKGDVYIGDAEYIKSIKDKVYDRDVLIIIGHKDDDPNAKILSSYKIEDPRDRYEILSILNIYSMYNKSDWNRTLESMRVEWTVHNILYDLNYKRERTEDVDLNNSDEEFYSNKVLQRLIK